VRALLSDMSGDIIEAIVTKGGGSSTLPASFSLDQNYPNPFNPATEMSFSIATAGTVKLDVFNTLGQLVSTLVDEHLSAGHHTRVWNASNNASGVYFYRLQIAGFAETKKMILMK